MKKFKLSIILLSFMFIIGGCGTASPEDDYEYPEEVYEESPVYALETEKVYETMHEEVYETYEEVPMDHLDSMVYMNAELHINQGEYSDDSADLLMYDSLVYDTIVVEELLIEESITTIHAHDLPPNSLIFPNHNTGYDWQVSDTTKDESIWVGIQISDKPNKNGNYAHNVYITSNTISDSIISHIVVSGIDILFFSEDMYVNNRSNEKGMLQSENSFKEQLSKEIKESDNKEHLFIPLDEFKQPTLIITHDPILVHTFFLSNRESEIIVMWKYIKKID